MEEEIEAWGPTNFLRSHTYYMAELRLKQVDHAAAHSSVPCAMAVGHGHLWEGSAYAEHLTLQHTGSMRPPGYKVLHPQHLHFFSGTLFLPYLPNLQVSQNKQTKK